jgi:periplasmic glucans biosynthesis protein
MVFLGASYFRMVGRGQTYGLSLRGLAVDTALPSGEEFPRFTEFWLVRPEVGANRMEILALLDSASVTGAYAFEVDSRTDTVVTVHAQLFARKDVRRLGIAPLTSMYAWGTTGARGVDDYRPKVHDSDGLMQLTGAGEWIWRPLNNPPSLQVSSLADSGPQGFGLAQRNRRFESYQDPETRYEQRPGVWVTPLNGDWGRGAVQLVEIPAPDETHDNIVAYWLGEEPLRAGQSRSYQYRLRTFGDFDNPDGLATVTGTRQGWAWVPGTADPPPRGVRRFVVDFEGGELMGLAPGQPVRAELAVNGGRADEVNVTRLPYGDVWRAAFQLTPANAQRVVDMRLYLTLRDRRLSETWSYLWDPAAAEGR